MRFATDTGGTFTDLIVEYDDGRWAMYKASTTPDDPVVGVINALAKAADDNQCDLTEFVSKGDVFIHGTTHAINAIITGNTAKTAIMVTKGHPDILLMREGGRSQPFNHTLRYPDPYVPRDLTFEIDERVNYAGDILTALDENSVITALDAIKNTDVEAIAVALLWSISNGAHEERIGALIEARLGKDFPYTLSHRLNPTLREYRRASSTSIDASLKPLMGRYLDTLTDRLSAAGFAGHVYVVSSQGGMMAARDMAGKPIHAINSGPSMAPISGRYYASRENKDQAVIVADTGGTTYDLSLVRDGQVPMTREMWVGEKYLGHMTGFPSVDVKSIGAGGGSIAWVDAGGMLHVGPQSAGSTPGPACYQNGGMDPTLTDASLVLGYLDPDFFLGGAMEISVPCARNAIEEKVAKPLGISIEQAAWDIVDLATENMTQAIVDITVNQGIDPASAILIGGGGAAGLNSTFIAKRLGCKKLIIPEVGAALSAAGALLSDLTTEHRKTHFVSTDSFDMPTVNAILDALKAKCMAFVEEAGDQVIDYQLTYKAEARYPNQVWEIEIPFAVEQFSSALDLEAMKQVFHENHKRIFAINDTDSEVEIVTWSVSVRCRICQNTMAGRLSGDGVEEVKANTRSIIFANEDRYEADIIRFEAMKENQTFNGPAIVESPFTTVVVDPQTQFSRTQDGSLILVPTQETTNA